MIKRWITYLVLGTVWCSVFGQKDVDFTGLKIPQEKKVNWGFKFGVNTSSFYTSNLKVVGYNLAENNPINGIGYTAGFFSRFNFNKGHFLQLELNYVYRDLSNELVVNRTTENDFYDLSILIYNYFHCLDLPVLYGYNIIKTGPYTLNVFAGPVVKHIINYGNKKTILGFMGDDPLLLYENVQPVALSLLLGVGVDISFLTIDFRYEIGLTKATNNTFMIPESGTTLSHIDTSYPVHFNRQMGTLSFTLGFVF